MDGGQATLWDAYIGKALGDSGWTFLAGQFKVPLLREEGVYSQNQLAVERSLVATEMGAFRTQGVAMDYRNDTIHFTGGWTDGHPATGGFNMPALAADTELSLTGRVEWLASGDWGQFNDLTSFRGGEQGMLFGAAIHWQNGSYGTTADEAEVLVWTVDGSFEFGGANAFAFVVNRDIRVGGSSVNQWGIVAQGGYFIDDDVELYARYEWGRRGHARGRPQHHHGRRQLLHRRAERQVDDRFRLRPQRDLADVRRRCGGAAAVSASSATSPAGGPTRRARTASSSSARRSRSSSEHKMGLSVLAKGSPMPRPLRTMLAAGVALAVASTAPAQDTKPVEGIVLSADGKPVAGAKLAAMWMFEDGTPVAPDAMITDEKGRFSGEVRHWYANLVAYDADHTHAGLVTLAEGGEQSHVIRLAPVVRVKGRVTCSEIGRAPGWANFSLMVGRGPIAYCMSEDATIDLVVPRGDYGYDVYDNWFTSKDGTLDLTGKTDAVVDLGDIDLPAHFLAKHVGKPLPKWNVTDARGVGVAKAQLDNYRGKWVLLEFWGFW